MKQQRKRAALGFIAAVLALGLISFIVERQQQPVFEGKRMGKWYAAYCAGIEPPDVFARFDSRAVPFIVKKLRRPRSPGIEDMIARGRNNSILRFGFNFIEPPSLTRSHAARALRFLGPKAEAALPDLLAALEEEPSGSWVAQEFFWRSEPSLATNFRPTRFTRTKPPSCATSARSIRTCFRRGPAVAASKTRGDRPRFAIIYAEGALARRCALKRAPLRIIQPTAAKMMADSVKESGRLPEENESETAAAAWTNSEAKTP